MGRRNSVFSSLVESSNSNRNSAVFELESEIRKCVITQAEVEEVKVGMEKLQSSVFLECEDERSF